MEEFDDVCSKISEPFWKFDRKKFLSLHKKLKRYFVIGVLRIFYHDTFITLNICDVFEISIIEASKAYNFIKDSLKIIISKIYKYDPKMFHISLNLLFMEDINDIKSNKYLNCQKRVHDILIVSILLRETKIYYIKYLLSGRERKEFLLELLEQFKLISCNELHENNYLDELINKYNQLKNDENKYAQTIKDLIAILNRSESDTLNMIEILTKNISPLLKETGAKYFLRLNQTNEECEIRFNSLFEDGFHFKNLNAHAQEMKHILTLFELNTPLTDGLNNIIALKKRFENFDIGKIDFKHVENINCTNDKLFDTFSATYENLKHLINIDKNIIKMIESIEAIFLTFDDFTVNENNINFANYSTLIKDQICPKLHELKKCIDTFHKTMQSCFTQCKMGGNNKEYEEIFFHYQKKVYESVDILFKKTYKISINEIKLNIDIMNDINFIFKEGQKIQEIKDLNNYYINAFFIMEKADVKIIEIIFIFQEVW
ncbi:hypothetical protein HZS_1289 [Henneguya salminicola]|nr:hypothetical protein HZS_1289 [Henneguya salminicola]